MSPVPSGHVRDLVPDVSRQDMSGLGAEAVSPVVDSLPLVSHVLSGHVRDLVPDVALRDMSAPPDVLA